MMIDRAEKSPWADIAGRRRGRAHVLAVRVYYEDTDFSGLVYHASYFRFCERGRSDLLRLAGINHSDLLDGADGTPAVLAVRRIEADFLGAAKIDDVLEIKSHVAKISGARIFMIQEISHREKVLFRAHVVVVVVGQDRRPKRVGAKLRAALPLWRC
ncbi:MAG: YbgC/FadM family acyl-CoA thioesterase [Alphaproteobacteria bacterium]